jgi:hypothetical protein
MARIGSWKHPENASFAALLDVAHESWRRKFIIPDMNSHARFGRLSTGHQFCSTREVVLLVFASDTFSFRICEIISMSACN